MICYQTRYEDGTFVGTAQAHPDPLISGRMVIPGACVEKAPPPFQAGQQARWTGVDWIIEPLTFAVVAPGRVGLAIGWDGTEMTITEVPAPGLNGEQAAEFNGAAWIVTQAS